MTDKAPQMTLATSAAERKERLLALRKRKAGEIDGAEDGQPFHLKSRNFDPNLRQPAKHAPSRPINADEDGNELETVENRVKGLAESIIKEDEEKRAEELDLLNIQPKRANWDLKRDMDKRMKKLDRRTKEAYAHLFAQRLKNMKSGNKQVAGGDLVASMEAAEKNRRAERRAGGDNDQEEDEDEDME